MSGGTSRGSAIQCAAYVGGEQGRCPSMGLRENDEMIEVDGTGRMAWVSWCGFHKRWNEAHRAKRTTPNRREYP